MCSFCDEAGDGNNDTWRLDRQTRRICIDELKVDAHCALVGFGVIREVILGLKKLFLRFSVSSLSNANVMLPSQL